MARTRLSSAIGVVLLGAAAAAVAAVPPPIMPPSPRPAAAVDAFGDPLPPGAVARLGTVRLRHTAFGVSFAPDGQSLITAHEEVRIWETASGRPLRRFRVSAPRQDDPAYSQALAPGGRVLATGHTNNRVRLWDLTTGQEVRQWQGLRSDLPPGQRQAQVSRLAFSADGRLLVSVCETDPYARVWDVASGRELRRLLAPEGLWVRTVAFGAGTRLVGGASPPHQNLPNGAGPPGVVCVWDAATGDIVHSWPGYQPRGAVAFSPDGRLVAVGSAGQVSVRLADGERAVWQANLGGNVFDLAFAPGGQTLAAVGGAGPHRTAVVWDAASGREVRRWEGLRGWSFTIAYAPDGKTLATAGSNSIRLWDIDSGRELSPPRPDLPDLIGATAISPDGRLVASVGTGDTAVRVWELASGREVRRCEGLTHSNDEVTISPDGRLVAACDGDGSVRVWELATGRHIGGLPPNRTSSILRFTSDSRMLAASPYVGNAPTVVRLWDCLTGQMLSEPPAVPFGVTAVLATPDGRLLAVEHPQGTLFGVVQPGAGLRFPPPQVWDVRAGRLLVQLRGPIGPVQTAVIAPDGRTLATRGTDHAVRIFELATGGERQKLEGSGTLMTCTQLLALSPDGRTVASPDAENGIQLWDIPTGKLLTTLTGHGGRLITLEFTPDGRRLVSGSYDGTMLVWDVTLSAGKRERSEEALDEPALQASWDALRSEDAAEAHRALWRLVGAGDRAVAYLRERFHPPATVAEDQIRRWIGELGDDRFAVRERATKHLSDNVEQAEAAIRTVLKNGPPPEVRRRLQLILDRRVGLPAAPQRLQESRGLEVLERTGTAEARRLLAALAERFASTAVGREARLSLERLQHIDAR